MGAIVGAALVSHVPTIVLPEEVRRELNDGQRHDAGPGTARPAGPEARTARGRHRSWCSTPTGSPPSNTWWRRTRNAKACTRPRSSRAACARCRTRLQATASWPRRGPQHRTIGTTPGSPPSTIRTSRSTTPPSTSCRSSRVTNDGSRRRSARPPRPRTSCSTASCWPKRWPTSTAAWWCLRAAG